VCDVTKIFLNAMSVFGVYEFHEDFFCFAEVKKGTILCLFIK